MLVRKFSADPDVRAVDLGNQVNLEDPTIAFDHVHLTPKGNTQLVEGLAGPVLEIAARKSSK